jgi:putative DNA primase/helicase
LLVEIATASESGIELFHDDGEQAFATFEHGEAGVLTVPVRSGRFRNYLRSLFYRDQDKAPGSQAMEDALAYLEARAAEDHHERKVYLRVADLGDRVVVDTASGAGVVIVDAEGWNIEKRSPVPMLRSSTIRALPLPTEGSLDDLRPFINVSDRDFPLVVGFLLAALSGRKLSHYSRSTASRTAARPHSRAL